MNRLILNLAVVDPTQRKRSSTVLKTGQSGFTLIEILIAMLVLAIGLLGIAAMQFRGLQYSHDAYIRSQVSVLATDITDRMRLNRANADDYIGNYQVPAIRPNDCAVGAATAANDLACWRTQVYDAIPPGSNANITFAAGTGLYTVDLNWTDRENNLRQISYTFMP